jgi:uncharacterized protein YukE
MKKRREITLREHLKKAGKIGGSKNTEKQRLSRLQNVMAMLRKRFPGDPRFRKCNSGKRKKQ